MISINSLKLSLWWHIHAACQQQINKCQKLTIFQVTKWAGTIIWKQHKQQSAKAGFISTELNNSWDFLTASHIPLGRVLHIEQRQSVKTGHYRNHYWTKNRSQRQWAPRSSMINICKAKGLNKTPVRNLNTNGDCRIMCLYDIFEMIHDYVDMMSLSFYFHTCFMRSLRPIAVTRIELKGAHCLLDQPGRQQPKGTCRTEAPSSGHSQTLHFLKSSLTTPPH